MNSSIQSVFKNKVDSKLITLVHIDSQRKKDFVKSSALLHLLSINRCDAQGNLK